MATLTTTPEIASWIATNLYPDEHIYGNIPLDKKPDTGILKIIETCPWPVIRAVQRTLPFPDFKAHTVTVTVFDNEMSIAQIKFFDTNSTPTIEYMDSVVDLGPMKGTAVYAPIFIQDYNRQRQQDVELRDWARMVHANIICRFQGDTPMPYANDKAIFDKAVEDLDPEPGPYNIEFTNNEGMYDETQYDLSEGETFDNLFRLWCDFCAENELAPTCIETVSPGTED